MELGANWRAFEHTLYVSVDCTFCCAVSRKGPENHRHTRTNRKGSTWATVDSGSHKKKKGAIKLSNNLTIRRKSDDESNDRYDKSNDVQN